MQKVSVIIPVYNRPHEIGTAIESVLLQTHPAFEVIVVDDASTDHTREVVGSFQDKQIRLVQLPVNQGPAAARNAGIRAAKGEYVAFLDSDDKWLPEKMDSQLWVMNNMKSAEAVTCDVLMVHKNGQEEIKSADPTLMSILSLNTHAINVGSSLLIRRDALHQVGLFNPALRYNEDVEWLLRFITVYPQGLAAVPSPCVIRQASPLYTSALRMTALEVVSKQAETIKATFGRAAHDVFKARQHLDTAFTHHMLKHRKQFLFHLAASLFYSPKPATWFAKRALALGGIKQKGNMREDVRFSPLSSSQGARKTLG